MGKRFGISLGLTAQNSCGTLAVFFHLSYAQIPTPFSVVIPLVLWAQLLHNIASTKQVIKFCYFAMKLKQIFALKYVCY